MFQKMFKEVLTPNSIANNHNNRTGKFLFNDLFNLASTLTGGTPNVDDEEDDLDQTRKKNCTCGTFKILFKCSCV